MVAIKLAYAAQTAPKQRLSGLEVLRGYAAFAVVLAHLDSQFFGLPDGVVKATVAQFGLAVPLFFALSAFSLLYGYSTRIFDERSLTRFYVRRFFRIAPLFYAMLVLYIARWHFLGDPVSGSEVALNLTFLFPILPETRGSMVPAGWSLGIEWLFYFTFPLFVLVSRNVLASSIVFGATLVLSYSVMHVVGPTSPDFKYSSILNTLKYFQAGVLAFAIAKTIPQRLSLPLMAASVVALFVNSWMGYEPQAIFALICGLWVLCAASTLGVFDNVVTRFLGRVSYGIYLIHAFVMLTLKSAGFYDAVASFAGGYLGYCIALVVSAGLTIALAAISYAYLESPAIQWGDRLLKSRQAATTERDC
jgi:peptidoglycan/LPS O-acetylase OafA/YrhL